MLAGYPEGLAAAAIWATIEFPAFNDQYGRKKLLAYFSIY